LFGFLLPSGRPGIEPDIKPFARHVGNLVQTVMPERHRNRPAVDISASGDNRYRPDNLAATGRSDLEYSGQNDQNRNRRENVPEKDMNERPHIFDQFNHFFRAM
jgi:hypothetical protein